MTETVIPSISREQRTELQRIRDRFVRRHFTMHEMSETSKDLVALVDALLGPAEQAENSNLRT